MRRADMFMRAQAAAIRTSALSKSDPSGHQTRADGSADAVTMRLPSGLKLAESTAAKAL
jgi:hypothetical protein